MERKNRMYRHLKTLEQAGAILRARFGDLRVPPETIAVREALDRILTEPVTALSSVPA